MQQTWNSYHEKKPTSPETCNEGIRQVGSILNWTSVLQCIISICFGTTSFRGAAVHRRESCQMTCGGCTPHFSPATGFEQPTEKTPLQENRCTLTPQGSGNKHGHYFSLQDYNVPKRTRQLPIATSLSHVLEHPSVNRQDHHDKILALRGGKSFQGPEEKKYQMKKNFMGMKKTSRTELTCFEQSLNSAVILPHSC